jgi:hypothetical protein
MMPEDEHNRVLVSNVHPPGWQNPKPGARYNLTKRRSDKIIGATMVARHAGEMINEISLAMSCGLGPGAISNVIHPYPAQGQAIKGAADLYNRSRLTPLVKTLTLSWLRVLRTGAFFTLKKNVHRVERFLIPLSKSPGSPQRD